MQPHRSSRSSRITSIDFPHPEPDNQRRACARPKYLDDDTCPTTPSVSLCIFLLSGRTNVARPFNVALLMVLDPHPFATSHVSLPLALGMSHTRNLSVARATLRGAPASPPSSDCDRPGRDSRRGNRCRTVVPAVMDARGGTSIARSFTHAYVPLKSTDVDELVRLVVTNVEAGCTRLPRMQGLLSRGAHSLIVLKSSPDSDVDADTDAADCGVTAEPKLITRCGRSLTPDDW